MATTIDKPSGMTVFPRHGEPDAPCLLGTLLEREPWRVELEWPGGFEGGIAHRLDVFTSGAILVADTPEELVSIRAAFREKHLEKTYLLWAARDVPWDANRIARPIAHDRRKRGRMVVQRGERTPHRGKWYDAETRFERIEGRLFRATMRTGVMHQIRVHAAFLGIPLLGDRRYGGGAPADDEAGYRLHHVGLRGARIATTPVAPPSWFSEEPG